jgi:membrane associated rhomboid family serine protease
MSIANILGGSVSILGGRVSRVVLAVIVGTLVGTIVTTNATTALVLVPEYVLKGEVWRLVTWPLVQPDALGLIFACLFLWYMGPDLVYAWGPGGYLLRYLVLAGATGVVTCLLALVFTSLRHVPFVLGAWSMVDALIMAWALMFPQRQVYQFFVLPMSGRNLVYFTLGANVLFALLSGPGRVLFLTCFVAMGLMLAHLYFPTLRRMMWQLATGPSTPKRPRHLRPVDAERGDKPRWLH